MLCGRGRAAEGVLRAALAERADDAGPGDGVQLGGDGTLHAPGVGDGRGDVAGDRGVPGADGPGAGGQRAGGLEVLGPCAGAPAPYAGGGVGVQ